MGNYGLDCLTDNGRRQHFRIVPAPPGVVPAENVDGFPEGNFGHPGILLAGWQGQAVTNFLASGKWSNDRPRPFRHVVPGAGWKRCGC
jgi:hypothetical protein